MAILKQNGDNGKIIRAQSSGKILKQNYNFGKGLVFANGETFTRSFSGLNQFSFILSDKAFWPTRTTTSFIMTFTDVDGNKIWVRYLNSFPDNLQYYINFSPASTNIYWVTSPYFNGSDTMHEFSFDGEKVCLYSNSIRKYHDIPITFNLSDFNLIISPMGPSKITRLNFFDRLLTDIERDYLCNDRLGNELLNRAGVLGDYTNNKAEIIDFGSEIGQAIGVKDEVKDAPLLINNLPAGTLQEQLNYANANLFE